ncbi:MAG: glycoside hydrolase family 2, partial [Muribaculaceae bacterium]|nr:glycoside hydrolase family 2 [Muribaculaceae bacterium]
MKTYLNIMRLMTLLGISIASVNPLHAEHAIDLSGKWSVLLENDSSTYEINLPGTTDDAGIGVPDTLTPQLTKPQLLHLTRKNRYVGPAVYSRTVKIPKGMAGKPLRLKLERVLWKSCLEIDGKPTGYCEESLTTPHEYKIREGLSEGEHTVTLRIDNSKQYGISTNNLAHAYTDDTQIMWNGVLGDMILEEIPSVDIHNVQIYPDINESKAVVSMNVNNYLKKKTFPLQWKISGLVDGKTIGGTLKKTLNNGENIVVFSISDPELRDNLWSEYNPQLLTFEISTKDSGEPIQAEFGMREFSNKEGKFHINGNPVFLRGTLECCIFPLTGTPPTDEAGWEKVFKTAKEWGLNHLRFHSWCPPEAAFRVADRMGFYLQVECPLWSVDIEPGTDGANGDMKNFIKGEFGRISTEYGNHPSFCLMTVGNELQKDFDWLEEMTEYMHAIDKRHLYAASSFTFEKGHGGHPEPNDDFLVTQWTDNGWVRGQGVFDQEPPSFNKNYASSTAGLTVPLIEHEIGQYAVYPDIAEIDKYTGVLTPHNFEAVRNDLEKKGRLHKAKDYLMASGKLASILYKEELERALKTPGVSGIQMLGLQDFPGQGTALVGLVDAFWDSKGIVTPEWFRNFCSPTVPLADFEKAVYQEGETFKAKIRIADYSHQSGQIDGTWRLSDINGTISEGTLTANSKGNGLIDFGDISVILPYSDNARKLQLYVEIPEKGATNSWNIWVYPNITEIDFGDILATSDLSEAMKGLEEGRKVLLSPEQERINGTKSKFVPVFWSPVHFPKEAGAMGVLC